MAHAQTPAGELMATFGPNPAPYGLLPGYTDNVDDEVNSVPQEMILQEKPAFLNGPNLHDRIFNSELSAEFLFRYQQQFGNTEAEENYFLTSRQGYYFSPTGPIATEVDAQRRLFAEYMLKRLTEYHTENVMKTDPQFKKVYEIKQQVSNVKVEVSPGMRFDMNYSFVGNTISTAFTNPYALTILTIRMDPNSYTPTSPIEYYLQASRPIWHHYSAVAGYTYFDKSFRVAVADAISPRITATLTETFHTDGGYQVDGTREGLTMFNFSWGF